MPAFSGVVANVRSEDLNAKEKYVQSLYAVEDAGLVEVAERLKRAGRFGVNIGANEGKILQMLMKFVGARRAVEIGTLFGYSAVWLARALPAGDATARLWTIERDHDCVREARETFRSCGVEDRVTLLEGEAAEKLRELQSEGPFDLVFIDANKAAYMEYLEWAERNVRPGGLIVADNTFLGGGVVLKEKPDHISSRQWNEMRKFNETLGDSSRFMAMILPTHEGLSVAIRL
jgi:predicted O-methyltransferase YrrM